MTQPPVTPGYQPPPSQASSGLAVASLVLGIISCASFCVIWVSAPLGVLAIVLAVVALGQIRRGEAGGSGMAKSGMVLGMVGIVLSIVILVLASAGLHLLGKTVQKAQEQQQRIDQQRQQHPSTEPGT